MVFIYDGTFEGFLTVVFEAFRTKTEPLAIVKCEGNPQLPLGECVTIPRDEKKAKRVWAGLEKRTSAKGARLIRIAFLSGEPQACMLLWRYLKKIFTSHADDLWKNMLDDDIYETVQMARRVHHEVHRFHGFVRFQKTTDDIWFAAIDPDHDIVHLLTPHFRKRYPEQPWVIYDTRRNRGVYFDTRQVMEVVLDNPGFDLKSGNLHEHVKAPDQDQYRELWKAYYDAINIIERKNPRQMKRLMPQRYWKYLPEKD